LVGAWKQYQRTVDVRIQAAFARAFACYALAVASWAMDNGFCDFWHSLPGVHKPGAGKGLSERSR
jgi:hypothetical protein